MRFPPSFIEEIKQRLPVSAVVGKRVRLQKAGREWKGLSPFNSEKTPSFFVNDQKQAWFDFSSGKNGNIFTFVMETEGLSFPEAVERLAGEAGLQVPQMSREAEEREEKRASLYDVMEMAARFFEEQLRAAAGSKARAYLGGRDLGLETQRAFRLGFAPNEKFALRDWLASKGVAKEAMIEAGLLVHGDDIAVPYDRFRDRVMFPIADSRGKIIAFGGRAMEKDVPAKYLNSPDTPLFHKGHVLYNHHIARKAAHDRGTVIAVEGYVDVIAMSRAGFPNAVAPLGTALTQDQLGLLWRMGDEPILCFDGDKAGRRAAYRAIDNALPLLQPGKSLRFALLPEGQDPDDLLRTQGAGAIETAIGAARPLAELLWTREYEAQPLDTPERRAAFEARMREALSAISDESVRRHYRADMDERLRGLFDIRRDRPPRGGGWGGPGRNFDRAPGGRFGGGASFASGLAAKASPGLASHPMFAARPSATPREAMILAIFARHPVLLERRIEELADLHLTGRDAERFRRGLIDVVGSEAEPEAIPGLMQRIGLTAQLAHLEGLVRPGDRWLLDPEANLSRVSDALRQALALHRRAVTLHTELKAAERALAESDDETALARILEVKTELADLDGTEADPDEAAAAAGSRSRA
ncbi:DNA primase [Terrarubrum flagellatum]|uniref:DNA primase n=1 Tax=Terrirubrum flagellatum TaxID=2895980 RepID=UPI0031450EE1